MGSRIPRACRHYQQLPSATIKPNTPKNLDSIRDITAGIVDTQSGGPEGRLATHTPSGMAYCSKPRALSDHHARWGPATLTPRPTAIASATAYDPIIDCEAYYFGKKILRMAGIAQMLHALQPPYDKYLLNAHTERTRARQPRNQVRASASMASQVP